MRAVVKISGRSVAAYSQQVIRGGQIRNKRTQTEKLKFRLAESQNFAAHEKKIPLAYEG
ncbi:MAG: hypothetical protein QXY84_00645 [Candidatus Caldarchaeum sp.]